MLTYDLDFRDVLFIEFSIFEDAMVLPIIIRVNIKDPEGHISFFNGIFQELCSFHIFGNNFSEQVFAIIV